MPDASLARYFGVDETLLGKPAGDGAQVSIQRLDLGAAAGGGSVGGGAEAVPHVSFDRKWLGRIAAGSPDQLSMIRVEGDSMSPTLNDGDEILVDRADGAARLRDGLYVLRQEDALTVKRLSVNPGAKRAAVISDNPAYPSWPDCRLGALNVVGRVRWVCRSLA